MTAVTNSQWSGNKLAEPGAHTRQEQTKRIQENAMRNYPGFCEVYLSAFVSERGTNHTQTIAQSSRAKVLCDLYVKSRDTRLKSSKSSNLYNDLVNLLNYLSEQIHDKFRAHEKPKKVVFVDYHDTMPDHHPKYMDTKVFPDIIAILESTKAQHDQQGDHVHLSWHHILSAVEEKSPADKKNGPKQCGTYLAYACQARPDVAAMYGVSFAPTGYRILYNDAMGVTTSDEIDIDDLVPLTCYVYALYSPPDTHHTRDTSITLASRLFEEPRWNVEFKNVTYRNCRVRFVGPPHKRQTWIAVCEEPLAVIKDSWWSDDRNWNEGELFNVLHKKGAVPGWVQIRSEGMIPAQSTPNDPNPGNLSTFCLEMGRPRKFKKRVIMSTYGEHLSRCGSVLEFLKAMYDVLEAHRFAALDRNILHRDISQENILIRPKGPDTEPMAGRRPKFIHEIVDGIEHAPPVAVLCDLDNGCELDHSKAQTPSFMRRKMAPKSGDDHRNPQRTGTPMYMARALCEAQFLRNTDYEQMPRLPDVIMHRYLEAHSDPPQPIRSLEDVNGAFHGSKRSDELSRYIKQQQLLRPEKRDLRYHQLFYHRPRYDAESAYWVIVTFLLLAKPRSKILETDHSLGPDAEDEEEQRAIADDDEVDDNLEPMRSIWKAFASHKILDTTDALAHVEKDSRHAFFDRGPEDWATVLHAKLADAGLAQMLSDLSQQVQPEYIYLEPDLDTKYPDHLHEAIQRILLTHMLPLWDTDGIPLYRTIHRKVPQLALTAEFRDDDGRERTAKGQSHQGTRGSKRNDDSPGDGSRASKRSKGNDGSADQSREGEGSRASRGSKRGLKATSGASAGPSTIVTRSQRKK
ncbi:hypothetical protein HGRIS_010886 [Hohenbuehelia grisea]|uniref:Fungal-type protein kinase domain-containing protein n=1 Tax=Hohenbuehelia grisea TaxID=104357 RepID=A0ABR3IYF1_9AGAR